jgi:hypothetical protein
MSDPIKDFLDSITPPFQKAQLRIQSWEAETGWWVRVAENGKEDDPRALLIGPHATKEEAREAAGKLMHAMFLKPVTMNGMPVVETDA